MIRSDSVHKELKVFSTFLYCYKKTVKAERFWPTQSKLDKGVSLFNIQHIPFNLP